jgi:hypothetical protein
MCMYWQHKKISLFWHKFFFSIFTSIILQRHWLCQSWLLLLMSMLDEPIAENRELLLVHQNYIFQWTDTVPLEKCRVTWCAISKLKQMRAVSSTIHLYMNQELYLVVLHGTRVPIDFWAPESILHTWALKEEAFLIRWVSTLIIMEVIENYNKNKNLPMFFHYTCSGALYSRAWGCVTIEI